MKNNQSIACISNKIKKTNKGGSVPKNFKNRAMHLHRKKGLVCK